MPHSPAQDESSCLLIAEAGKLITDCSFKVTENYISILSSFYSAHFYSLMLKGQEVSGKWLLKFRKHPLFLLYLSYMYKKPITHSHHLCIYIHNLIIHLPDQETLWWNFRNNQLKTHVDCFLYVTKSCILTVSTIPM